MKYRIKFSKTDKMRFIGHLDLLKLFQRTIKRTNLPIAYSKGFNPHQQMSFAVPLPLGMSSICEIVDIELEKYIDENLIVKSINQFSPEGFKILEVRLLDENTKNCASIIEAALYEINLIPMISNLDEVINQIMSQDILSIERTSKKITKTVDIKPDIYTIENISDGDNCKIKILISTGSRNNLKPDLFIKYLYDYMKISYSQYEIKYTRLNLFEISGKDFISL